MEDKMTLFYNKRTGTIKEICGGVQDLSWFGDESQDYEKIYDYIVVDFDNFVIQHLVDFEVSDNKLKMRQPSIPTKYL